MTPALPIIEKLIRPHVAAVDADRIGAIDYLGKCMRRSRADEEPFGTLLDERSTIPRFLLWASSSIPISTRLTLPVAVISSTFHATSRRPIRCSARTADDVVSFTLPHVQRMFPKFLGLECIRARARLASALRAAFSGAKL